MIGTERATNHGLADVPASEIAPVSNRVVLNGRFSQRTVTGVERYAREIGARLSGDIELLRPTRSASGIAGHLWEQTALPMAARDRVLWSPCNTGPLPHRRHVVSILDLATIDRPETFSARFAAFYGFLLRRLATRAAAVLVPSQFTAERVTTVCDVDPSKVYVTGAGAPSHFRVVSRDAAAPALTRHDARDSRYFLFVGSLDRRKNLSTLVRAFERAALPDDVELLVSGGRGAARVFGRGERITDTSRVRWLGYVADDDLPSLMSRALAVVVPSEYEGFGLPALEALSCGALVIASDRTSLPEVVGDAGILVPPREDELVDALGAVARDPESFAALRARAEARARTFTWAHAAAVTARVLSECSPGSRHR